MVLSFFVLFLVFPVTVEVLPVSGGRLFRSAGSEPRTNGGGFCLNLRGPCASFRRRAPATTHTKVHPATSISPDVELSHPVAGEDQAQDPDTSTSLSNTSVDTGPPPPLPPLRPSGPVKAGRYISFLDSDSLPGGTNAIRQDWPMADYISVSINTGDAISSCGDAAGAFIGLRKGTAPAPHVGVDVVDSVTNTVLFKTVGSVVQWERGGPTTDKKLRPVVLDIHYPLGSETFHPFGANATHLRVLYGGFPAVYGEQMASRTLAAVRRRRVSASAAKPVRMRLSRVTESIYLFPKTAQDFVFRNIFLKLSGTGPLGRLAGAREFVQDQVAW